MTPARAGLGFGIVGCGGAAGDVARGIDATPGAAVVATHDHDLQRAAGLAAPRGAAVHPTLAALLRDDRVDVVYIALPHDRLAPTSVAALRSGRHVLVEKPAAITTAGMRSIRDAADRAGRSVGVMFELRAAAIASEATRLVRSGALGRIRSIRIRTLIDKPSGYWAAGPTGAVRDPWRASRARAGGGVVLMNAIHQLDLVRAVTGLEPLRVGGMIATGVAGVEVEDAAVAAIDWSDGVLGSLEAAAHAPGATAGETIEIDGDHGALRLGDAYDARPELAWFLRSREDVPSAGWIRRRPRRVDPFAATVAAFVGAVRADRPPVPGLADADVALATVFALYRSARTGRFEPVRPVGPGGARPGG